MFCCCWKLHHLWVHALIHLLIHLHLAHVLLLLEVALVMWVSLLVASIVVASSTLSVMHSSSVIVHLSVSLLIDLNDSEQLLEHLSQMWLRGEIVPLETAGLLSLVLLPISLVLGLLHLHLSDFLDFVVVDDKHLSINVVVLEMLLGFGSIGWLLEANESEGVAGASVLESDVLNLTVWLEDVGELILAPAVGEVL